MKGKSIGSLALILVLVSVMMMNTQPVHATPYEYELYVDGFNPWITEWNVSGASPWLDAVDGSYIEGTFDTAWMCNFTFEDISLPPCEVITKVVLEGYTNGPYNDSVDYDVYTLPGFIWLGSLYATGAPAWVTPRWIGLTVDEAYPAALTEAGLNNLEVLVYFYDILGLGGANNTIDALRLKVYTAISATIDFTPNTINANTGMPNLKCTITLSCGFSASEINQSSILLDDLIAPSSFGPAVGSTLKVEFNMTKVIDHIELDILPPGATSPPPHDVTLNITFSLTDGTPFQGNETITFIAV